MVSQGSHRGFSKRQETGSGAKLVTPLPLYSVDQIVTWLFRFRGKKKSGIDITSQGEKVTKFVAIFNIHISCSSTL